MERWKPDKVTYDNIQKLKKFVDFVSNLEYATGLDKRKAKEIISLIENIDKPKTHKEWNVCLDIFDPEIQYGNEKEGFYWRKWSVYFELGTLQIEAETYHTADDSGHYGDDFYYYGDIFFNKNIICDRVYFEKDINEFINDAVNYKNYVTESLNVIEIDIDVWEPKPIQ
jgi:hypothetical protein